MVGMPEIYILGVGMGSKMLAFVCWNSMYFQCFCAGNDTYILEKLLGNILILSRNAGKLLQTVVTTLRKVEALLQT